MFIVLKRRSLMIILAVLVTCELCLTAALCAEMFRNTDTSIIDYTVVVDAGHGGVDGGVVGVNGTKESDINLLYSETLGKIFENCGFRVVYTRRDRNGLYGAATNGFKRRDMEKRKEIILSSQADIVVSVHMNKFSSGSRKGPQVFFQENSKSGKALADSIQGALNKFTGNSHAALKGDYFMTRCSDVPSVIVECGFLSNAEEEALLNTDEYRDKLTSVIFNGVMLYLYS